MIHKCWQRCWSGLLVCSFFSLFSLFLSGTALSGKLECDPDNKKDCIASLKKGEIAPFTGKLLSPKRAAKLIAAMEKRELVRELDLKKSKELCALQIDFAKANETIATEICSEKLELTRNAFSEIQKKTAKSWYDVPDFPIFVAVLAGFLGYKLAVTLRDN